MAAAGFGPILAAIGRQTPAHRRSLALGIATAGGSIGQFAVVPITSVLQLHFGDWHTTMLILALASMIMLPLSLGLREGKRANASGSGAAMVLSTSAALGEAFRTRGYWLLTIGFFVCGFHVAFIGLHLPSYIADKSVGVTLFGTPISPLELGGWSIGLVGLFNVIGSVVWGWLGGRYPRKDMLSLLYLLRALTFLLFFMLPLSGYSVLVFAATLGFLWLGTVPLTSGLVGYIFGPTHMSMLWGIVFFSHQVGSFLGGWLPGLLYDIQGNYDLMWKLSVGLGLAAAIIHWRIPERPVARIDRATAAA